MNHAYVMAPSGEVPPMLHDLSQLHVQALDSVGNRHGIEGASDPCQAVQRMA